MIVLKVSRKNKKNLADDRFPDMGNFITSTQGYDSFESFV